MILRDPPPLRILRRSPEHSAAEFKGRFPQELGPLETDADIAHKVASWRWYHTIELPGGVVTPGLYDHRPLVSHYGIPELSGRRVLDVGTMDGFWAFEFERRGGDVVAVDVETLRDLDFPPPVKEVLIREEIDATLGDGFVIAHQALGSTVQRLGCSVYELDPRRLGTFDVVHAGDLLLHLESPLAALRRIRSVTAGEAIIADCIRPDFGELCGEPRVLRYVGGWETLHWWEPSLDALAQMVIDAGFSSVDVHVIYRLTLRGHTSGPWRAVLKASP